MPRLTPAAAAALAAALVPAFATAQPAAPPSPRATQPYGVGNPLGVTPPGPSGTAGRFEPMSANAKVYGGIVNAESCVYDAGRGLVVVPNRGASQRVQANDGFVSLVHHDGSVHTARWVGVQPPAARRTLAPPLTLNDPFGSDVVGGVLYVADSDGNTGPDDPRVAVIRRFDLRTGAPTGEVRVPQAPWPNDLAARGTGRSTPPARATSARAATRRRGRC